MKYAFMSHLESAPQIHKIINVSSENLATSKYLGTTVTDQNW
jgi:hypothetical protein